MQSHVTVSNTISSKIAWKMEVITYSHCFDFTGTKDDKNIVVKWKLCADIVKTAKGTTSNLQKHLFRQHNSVSSVEIRPNKEETPAVEEDGCSP